MQTSPVCSASRTALITSRYQYRIPVGLDEPLERANLKDRQPDVYKRLMEDFEAWDKGMLHDPKAASVGFTSDQLADHFINER